MNKKMTRSEAGRLGGIKANEIIQAKKLNRINLYLQNPNKCNNCGISLKYKSKNNKFCSKSCSAQTNNIGIRRHGKPLSNCLNCNSKCKNGKAKYCSRKCHNNFAYDLYINQWLNGLRNGSRKSGASSCVKRWLMEKYNNKCQKCEWNKVNPITNKVPLEVNHIDGDWKNNAPTNLELLCPSCHAITPNYKALNRGNGRPGRK